MSIGQGTTFVSPKSAVEFFELLRGLDLVPASQIDKAEQHPELHQFSALDAARSLVRTGALTCLQAEWILLGKQTGYYLDDYKLLDLIAVGGMSLLYLAQDPVTKAKVVLKVLAENRASDAGLLARFQVEAELGRLLDHPNIAKVLGSGRKHDIHYIVMEYIHGANLHDVVEIHGALGWPYAIEFIRQSAVGLAKIHAAEMVHRDVKPGNLMVDSDGLVKVADLGLALRKGCEDEFSLCMIFGHGWLGTEDYISPEQAKDSFHVDSRADVYSLGRTLHYLLSGMVPRTSQADTQAIVELPDDIPSPVVAIVKKMVEPDPDNRYQTMDEVAAALQAQSRPIPSMSQWRKAVDGCIHNSRMRIEYLRREASEVNPSPAKVSPKPRWSDRSGVDCENDRTVAETTVGKSAKPEGTTVNSTSDARAILSKSASASNRDGL